MPPHPPGYPQNPRSIGRAPRLLLRRGKFNDGGDFSRGSRVEWRREPLWAATRGGRVEWRDTLAWPPWRKVAYAPGPSSCSYCDHFPCACRFSSRGSSAMATFRKSCGPADSVAVASRSPTSCRVPAAACVPARPALPWTAVAGPWQKLLFLIVKATDRRLLPRKWREIFSSHCTSIGALSSLADFFTAPAASAKLIDAFSFKSSELSPCD